MRKYIEIVLISMLLTGCLQTDKSMLEDVTDYKYKEVISYVSCNQESSNVHADLQDAVAKAQIAGISEEQIRAALDFGQIKAERVIPEIRESCKIKHEKERLEKEEKLTNKCTLQNKIVCNDKCCTEEEYSALEDATAAAADATAAAADATAAAADAAALAVDDFNADYTSEIAAIENEIKYAMDSYRYFYDLSNQIIYPDDVYPPEIRNHFIMPRMILCLNETKLACKEKELKQVNSTTVKLIYQWVGGADGAYSSIPNYVKKKAQVDYDILVQRGTNLTTKEAVDNASNYAKNAAINYYPKIALDAYEVTGLEEPAVNE